MANTSRVWISLANAVFLISGVASAQDRWHVDDDAAPGGDGTTWAAAFNSLQDGLAATAGNDVIWVAAGSYKPDVGAGQTVGDRTATFQLINGVALYGGFVGDEDPADFDLNARDFVANVTLLTGDLNGNDEPGFGNNSENSYHVVTGSGTDETAVIDGFTVTAGNANGPYQQEHHRHGGGMYDDAGSPTLTDCNFVRNTAIARGGGIANSASSPILTNCTFSQNSGGHGGGMFNLSSDPVMTDCTFYGNTGFSGGAMANDSSSPELTHCAFGGNTVGEDGGGMHNSSGSNPTLIDCTFGENTAGDDGGAMYNSSSSPTLTHCTFVGNAASNSHVGSGGGILNRESSPALTDCFFGGNSAGSGGGVDNQSSSSPTLANCMFIGNTSVARGGGMSNSNGSPSLTNCTFRGNAAGTGGGMSNASDSLMLTNCTFSGNSADFGGGLFNFSGSPTLTNCIFGGNHDRGGSDESAQIHGGSPLVTYSCIQGLDTLVGEGNIGGDPLLTGSGIHLVASSPCVDAGDPVGDYDGQTDVDGEPREIGVRVDMGADEFLDTDGDALPNWSELMHFGSPTAGVASADPDDDGRDNLAEYVGGTDPLKPPRTYYVDLSGDDIWDGLTQAWDGEHGPKATIQAGIDVAHPREGDVVVVTPGTYTGAGNRDMDFFGKAVVVRSSDPNDSGVVAATVIDCEGTSADKHRAFRFHSVEGPDSVVAGFTITGGYTSNGGAISCHLSSPTLTHCTFSGNLASDGGGVHNYFSTPTLTDCTFDGNVANYYEGGGMYNYGSSPTLTDCTFVGNTADRLGGGMHNESSSSPTLTHCTFRRNTAGDGGGGMYNADLNSPTLTNCDFRGNTVTGANGLGGGVYCAPSSASTLISCTFSGNAATGTFGKGGALYNIFSSPSMINCTFSGNTAGFLGGAVYNQASNPTLTNCILWGNIAGEGIGLLAQIYGGSPTVTYGCIQGPGWMVGEGNIGDDPMLARIPDVGADGVWGTEDDDYGDLRLTGGSPAVDAGDPGVVLEAGVVDLNGHARVLCGRLDMGAFEFGIGSLDCDEQPDLFDWGHLQVCFAGEDAGPYADGCEAFDFEFDGDVDLEDFAGFQARVDE